MLFQTAESSKREGDRVSGATEELSLEKTTANRRTEERISQ